MRIKEDVTRLLLSVHEASKRREMKEEDRAILLDFMNLIENAKVPRSLHHPPAARWGRNP